MRRRKCFDEVRTLSGFRCSHREIYAAEKHMPHNDIETCASTKISREKPQAVFAMMSAGSGANASEKRRVDGIQK
jgi:hypothetical protein